MSTYIVDRVDDNGSETTQQLEEMHQVCSLFASLEPK